MIEIIPNVQVQEDVRLKDPKYLRLRKATFDIAKPRSSGMIPTTTREFVVSRSAVAGIVYCPDEQKVLMLRQFRYPIYHETGNAHLAWIYETVAGLIDDGETPVSTFIREVEEEAGVIIAKENVTFETSYYVSPGFVNEKHFIFTATVDKTEGTSQDGGLDSEGEAIVSDWLSYDQILNLINGVNDVNGNFHKIVDGKTIMGLMRIGLA